MERILTRFPYSPEGAILRLAWLEGLSREEIAALTWDQVQFEDNALTLPDRTVPLAPSAEDCLRERHRLYAQRDPHVIISDRYQRPMPPESVSRLARTALDTEGQKVSLKDLRQDFVIRQLQTHDWTYAARVSGMAVSTLRGSFSQYFQERQSAAPALPPDDEQALLLARAAAQCALHALEAERFAAAQQLARQALSWNEASLYENAQVRLEMLRVLARCAEQTDGDAEAAFAAYRAAYTELQPAVPYHLCMARYQLIQEHLPAAEHEIWSIAALPEASRAEYLILRGRLACKKEQYETAAEYLRQADALGPLPKLLERELCQSMELASRELQDYKTAYEYAARQLKL